MLNLNKNIILCLKIISIFLISLLFFFKFFLDGSLPITNADPSNYFWTHLKNSKLNNFFNFWDSSYGNGVSVFSNDIFLSKFSLYSIFLSFFQNKFIGFTIFIWLQVFLSGIIICYYLKKCFKIDFVFCLIGYVIFIFSTAYLNGYLFNGFGGFIFLPLIIDRCNSYLKNKKIINGIYAGLILVLTHFFSNLAIVQFLIIVSSIYLILLFYNYKSKNNLTFLIKFLLVMFFSWFFFNEFLSFTHD